MMLLILKQQQTNLLKDRDILLQQLESKYNTYIHAILQQRVLISRAIIKQYDEMMNKVNDSIYNCINSKPNINCQQINNGINISPQNGNILSEENNKILINNDKPYKCTYCNHSCKTKQGLKSHITQKHTKDGKYKCIFCVKTFTTHQMLTRHERAHTKEKPFKCNKCNKCFTLKHTLKTHINQIHTNNGKYKCEYCPKRFSYPANLVAHTRCHTKEKSFKCDTCNKSFAKKRRLNVHKRIHTGEKPYVCNECGKNFSDRSNCKRHEKIHKKQY
eukprot:170844_1